MKNSLKATEPKATLPFQDKPKGMSAVGLARCWASLFSAALVSCSPPPQKPQHRWHHSVSCLTGSPWHVLWLLCWGLNLPLPPPYLMGSALPSPKLTKEFSGGTVMFHPISSRSNPFETGIHDKTERAEGQMWCVYGDEGNSIEMRMEEARLQTSGFASLSGWL